MSSRALLIRTILKTAILSGIGVSAHLLSAKYGEPEKQKQNHEQEHPCPAKPAWNGASPKADEANIGLFIEGFPLRHRAGGKAGVKHDYANHAYHTDSTHVWEKRDVVLWAYEGHASQRSNDGQKESSAQRLSKVHESPASIVGQVALPAYRAAGFALPVKEGEAADAA